MKNMKKYIYLILGTLLVVSAITMSGYVLSGNTTEVDVLVLTEQTMDNVINANGKLQYKAASSVKAPFSGIMDNMFVKNGTVVKKGDPLFSYYKIEDAYLVMASQYSGAGGIEALLSAASTLGNAEEILEEIKKYCPLETVCADQDGKIAEIRFSNNDVFEKNTVILKISEREILEVPVYINENHIQQIRIGQKADIVFNALPQKHYKGKVTWISNEASVTSGITGKETTVEVTLTLDQSDQDLRVGYSAVCSITISTDPAAIVLPYDVIRSDEGGDYVFLAENNFAKKIYITTGNEYKDGIAVKTGLSKNDKLILADNNLSDGQKIHIRNRMVQSDA